MKKLLSVVLCLIMIIAICACGNNKSAPATEAYIEDVTENDSFSDASSDVSSDSSSEPAKEAIAVMTYDAYMAAELQTEVAVEFYVQATQSWWDDQIIVYGQDQDGGYFAYNMACSEEDAAKLVPGTKIRVAGWKSEFYGAIELDDGVIVEFLDAEPWLAEPLDVTDLLGTDELIAHQNEKVLLKGLSVENIEYYGGDPGDDIFVTVGCNGTSYEFMVEVFLTGSESDVYQAVGDLNVGDVVDIEGFLCWYDGPNTHITGVTVVE